MKNRFVEYFEKSALVLPIVILCLGDLGRGVLNSLLFIYFAWGLLATLMTVTNTRFPEAISQKREFVFILLAWGGIYTSYIVSAYFNDSFDIGKKQIIVSLLTSMTLVFSLFFINTRNLLSFSSSAVLRFSLVILFIIYVVDLLECFSSLLCLPQNSVSTMNIAILASFILIFISVKKHKNMFFLYSTAAILILLLVSNSRTEVLMFLLMAVSVFAFRYRKINLLLLAPVVLVLVLVMQALVMPGGFGDMAGTLTDILNRLSSGRVAIWQMAFSNPPDNLLVGSGINNTMAYLPETDHRSALHNAFVEIWYESGLLGIFFWGLLLVLLLNNIRHVYLNSSDQHRNLYSIFFGSLVAVIVAGLFDKGYMSIYYKFFIFYLGAVLFVLGQPGILQSLSKRN